MPVLRTLQPSGLPRARWQIPSAAQVRTRLFAHRGELYAARSLHACQLPGHQAELTMRVEVTTTEFGQKIFVGLVDVESLGSGPHPAGVGVSLDPETGFIEDVIGSGGILGDVYCLPMEAGRPVAVALHVRYFGLTFIPTLQVGEERVVLPAMLVPPGRTVTALVGGVVTEGALPVVEHSELAMCSMEAAPMMHG